MTAVDVITAPTTTANGGSVDALAAAICLGEKRSTLLFASYERTSQREKLVLELRDALPELNLVELSLNDGRLGTRDRTSGFFEKMRTLADGNGGDRPIDAVLLVDWEKRLRPAALRDEQATTTLTGLFNRGRNHLTEAFPLPIVVLVPSDTLGVIEERAPDFVSWKSGVFSFSYDEDDETGTSPPIDSMSRLDRKPWEVFRGAAALEDEIFGRETDIERLLEIER